MSSEQPATLIAIAVVQRGEEFLIGQRPPGVALAGLWEFPGGKMQPGESAEEAAMRECAEETGLAVVATFRYPDQTQEYDHGRVHLHFIHCEPVTREGNAPSEPQSPWRWIERTELRTFEFPAGNKGLIELLAG
jgi:mutator protein MutT